MSKSFAVKTFGWLLLAALCLLAPRHAMADTTLIDKGAAKATIYLDEKAPDTVKRAALDLQDHLKQITDVQLPVTSDTKLLKGFVIYLGDTAFARKQGIKTTQLPADGFRIVANKKWMVIAGKDYGGPPMTGFQDPYLEFQTYNKELKLGMFGNAGTLAGTYHFLEKYCGVRWYMPGPLGTVIPRTPKIAIPAINIQLAPYYPQRHAFYAYMDWFPDDMLWYHRAGFGSPAPVQVNHSFVPLFSKYKETHPEYFAIINGQRDFTNLSTEEGGGNLNLSDPGLIQQAITDARKYFDDNPEQFIFPLCPPDGMTKISEDPVSQSQIDMSQGPAGQFSNYVWGFINKVAKEVGKTHPDKFIGGFAYERYAAPPTNIDKLEPNVLLVITKFRARYPDPDIRKSQRDRYLAWNKKVSTIYNWEYYCNPLYNRAWQGFPMSFPHLIQEDLQFLKGRSRGEFIEAENWANNNNKKDDIRLNRPGMQHLVLYTTARLLWNPDLNVDAMMSEYYKLFYGPAEVPMRAFWERIEATFLKKSWQMSPYQVYDGATITAMLESLKQAKEKTTPDSIYRKRVEMIMTEFAPAAEVALKQETLASPTAEVPALKAPPVMTADAPLPPLSPGSPILTMTDRNFRDAVPVTNAQVAWDKDNFYIDMRCYEPAMDKLKTLATKRDSSSPWLSDDDCVEIFVSPNPAEPAKTFHYIISAAGVFWDSRIEKVNAAEDLAYTGNARWVVRKEANRWVVRLAIPWMDLGVQNPQAGAKMVGNIIRTRHAAGEFMEYGWAAVKHTAFYTPEDFGTFVLAGEPGQAPALANPAVVQPAGTKEFGSGPSAIDVYYEGGVPDRGLFVGQANPYVRNDRALCKFNLTPLLDAGAKVQKVELTFGVNAVEGKLPEREITIYSLPNAGNTLDKAVLASTDTETLGVVKVSQEGSYTAAQEKKAAYEPYKLDVTAAVRAALAKGQTSFVVRWQDLVAEKTGNPNGEATGALLSDGKTAALPSLVVTLAP